MTQVPTVRGPVDTADLGPVSAVDVVRQFREGADGTQSLTGGLPNRTVVSPRPPLTAVRCVNHATAARL